MPARGSYPPKYTTGANQEKFDTLVGLIESRLAPEQPPYQGPALAKEVAQLSLLATLVNMINKTAASNLE
jgi:hypothetical protein